ncbi:MAG: hypothetical protein ACXVB9_06995 [Bdellovibrionota bacterium]
MQKAVSTQRNDVTQQPPMKRNTAKKIARGPSLFEVEYLRQMKEELEIFLRSKNFNTIQAFEIAFVGADYDGLMKISA